MKSPHHPQQTESIKKTQFRWQIAALLVVYLLLYVLPLGNRALVIPDETRYAEIPREMLTTGDWVTPRIDGLRYFEKTPLGYWLNAASIATFGENPFAVRLPSAVAVGLTLLLILLFCLKTFTDRRVAVLAAFIQMTFLEVYFVGTFAVLDSLLTLFLTGTMMAYYLAVKEQKNHLAWTYYTVAGVLMGLAFLTKGFLAIAIPVIVFVPWLVVRKDWRALFLKSAYTLLIASLLVLPWGILIQLRDSDFWRYFFWVEHIRRFIADNAQHKAPFYYFLVSLPVLAFPWVSFISPAITGLRASVEKRGLLQFLWLWLVIPFLFFSLSRGKLETYILPCFPPLAILLAAGLDNYLRHNNKQAFNRVSLFNGMVLLSVLALLLVQQFAATRPLYQQTELLKLVMVALTLLAAVVACLRATKSTNTNVKLILTGTAVLPLIVLIQFAMPNQIKESDTLARLFTEVGHKIGPDTLVVSDGSILRAVNWYLKRADVYLLTSNEMSYGLSYPDATGRLLNARSFAALLANRHNRQMAVFCAAACPPDIQKRFPATSQGYHYGKFSMWLIPLPASPK